MDRKDAVIQMLDRDLEDAEEQYGMAVRGHGAIVQQLLDLQYQRMQVRSLPALVLCLLGPRWSHVPLCSRCLRTLASSSEQNCEACASASCISSKDYSTLPVVHAMLWPGCTAHGPRHKCFLQHT